MPRIFWSPGRKRLLLKQSEKMTVEQMAKHHLQPVAEIKRMLSHLRPDGKLIQRIYFEGRYKVTVYYPGYADGIFLSRAHCWNSHVED